MERGSVPYSHSWHTHIGLHHEVHAGYLENKGLLSPLHHSVWPEGQTNVSQCGVSPESSCQGANGARGQVFNLTEVWGQGQGGDPGEHSQTEIRRTRRFKQEIIARDSHEQKSEWARVHAQMSCNEVHTDCTCYVSSQTDITNRRPLMLGRAVSHWPTSVPGHGDTNF